MLALVDQLLDAIMVDRGHLQLDIGDFSAPGLIDDVSKTLRIQLHQKRLRIESSLDPSIDRLKGDTRRCQQILAELLSNAIKYSPVGSAITIRVEKAGSSMAKISVEDKGIGISPEQLKSIFSEFHQENRERDESLGGLGLGLAISRRLVEMHGGELGVDSTLGEGSVFWFTLPVSSGAAGSPATKIHARESFPGKRILVVEDNHVNLILIRDILLTFDIAASFASDGEEAFKMAKAEHPDLILMDLRLPLMDGYETTRALRAIPEFADMPIVALSASVDAETLKQCEAAGFTEHLAKPILSRDLERLLRRHIR